TATPTLTPTATPWPLQVTIALEPSQVIQGQSAIVRVAANRPCALSGAIEGRPLLFVPESALAEAPYRYTAYVGVHAMAPLGAQTLWVQARTKDGQQVTLETTLTVLAGKYAEERIRLTAETQKLLDPAISEPEQRRIDQVYARRTPTKLWQGTFSWPWQGPITSSFGTRRAYGGGPATTFHAGLDIDGETGDPVQAPAAGIVALAEVLQVRGGTVILDHGAGVLSGYFHLQSIAVREGETVEPGTLLGEIGSTGLSTGSHLHWEMRIGGIAVDPREWLERPMD
ncbi:MAG: M23 family metallopeptidase, partial [Chloroflexi bacterium]|nr:M23 family metallopeptidase [Chloroflexota bacterium]